MNKVNPKLTYFFEKMHQVTDSMSIRLIEKAFRDKFVIKEIENREKCAGMPLIFQVTRVIISFF